MGWIKPAGKKAVKFGPQALLLWQHAGRPVTEAAQQVVTSRQGLRTALSHADTVRAGAILRVIDAGVTRWVVFSNGEPVACYPLTDTPLERLVEHADLAKSMTPDQFRARRAERSRRRRVMDSAGNLAGELRRRRDRLG
jgi:hypothetical protein